MNFGSCLVPVRQKTGNSLIKHVIQSCSSKFSCNHNNTFQIFMHVLCRLQNVFCVDKKNLKKKISTICDHGGVINGFSTLDWGWTLDSGHFGLGGVIFDSKFSTGNSTSEPRCYRLNIIAKWWCSFDMCGWADFNNFVCITMLVAHHTLHWKYGCCQKRVTVQTVFFITVELWNRPGSLSSTIRLDLCKKLLRSNRLNQMFLNLPVIFQLFQNLPVTTYERTLFL